MAARALGFRPDPAGTRYRAHHHAVRAEEVRLPNSDLSPWRAGRVYQGHIGSCAHEAPKRAVQLRTAILRGTTADPFLASDQAQYAGYRKFEAALGNPGLSPEALPTCAQIGDTGSYPSLVLRYWQEMGIVLEHDWPGPASGRVDWDTMLATEPGSSVLVKAYDARGLEFQQVDLSRGLRRAVLDLHPRACPVMCAINADGIANSDPGNGVVSELPRDGQNHYVMILSGEDLDWAILDNWWSDERGPDGAWGIQSSDQLRGCWRVKWSTLDRGVSDVLAVTGLPASLSRKAA